MTELKTTHACVIIPASGKGIRFNKNPPKQFEIVNSKPIICHTISAFERLDCISHIVVTAPIEDEWYALMESIVEKYDPNKVFLTKGAKTRHRSILQGLECLKSILQLDKCEKDPVVIIHDGVRPFVDEKTILDVIDNTNQYKAVGVVRPLVSTVISIDEESFMKESLDRSTYWASEMPQGFLFSLIYNGYLKCSSTELDHGTECLKIALNYSGIRPKILMGSDNLWKITYSKDMIVARNILKGIQLNVYTEEHDKTNPIVQDILNETQLEASFIIRHSSSAEHVSLSITKSINCFILHSKFSTEDITSDLNIVLQSTKNLRSKQCFAQTSALIICFLSNDIPQFQQLHSAITDYSKQLRPCNVLLYGMVASNMHITERIKECFLKLLADSEGLFAGQIFYF